MASAPQVEPPKPQPRSIKPPHIQAAVIARRATGQSKRQICKELGIARNTVDTILKTTDIDATLQAEAMKVAAQAHAQAVWQPEQVKSVIRNRLLGDIVKGKSSGVAREAELLGRDKTVDMWVRPADVQIGIFNALQGDSAAILDQLEPGELIQASTTPALAADTQDQP